jgi:hypothetical protein
VPEAHVDLAVHQRGRRQCLGLRPIPGMLVQLAEAKAAMRGELANPDLPRAAMA